MRIPKKPLPGVVPLIGAILIPASLAAAADDPQHPRPHAGAHAHNDYRHPRPLLDALSHGFTSVEADIFLAGGELLVGHERSELRPGRTLERLYLAPLAERVRRNGGSVYPGGADFTLLIDIKEDGKAVYAELRKLLAKYRDILTTVAGGRAETKAVTVVLSGDRDWDGIAADAPRYAAVDGRLADLEGEGKSRPVHLMPLVSDNWRVHFRWRGEGPMPEDEREKLRRIVAKAHEQGRRVRFWATPERVEVWRELLAAGVDYVNTDDLAGLEMFLADGAAKEAKPALEREAK